jgi:hypothetical protein
MVEEQDDARKHVAMAAMNSLTSFGEATAIMEDQAVEHPSHKISAATDLLRQSFKVLVGLGQILASCSTSYNIPWPESFSYVFEVTSLMNISPYQLPAINCLYSDVKFFTRALWYFIAPPVLTLYIFAVRQALLYWVARANTSLERCVYQRCTPSICLAINFIGRITSVVKHNYCKLFTCYARCSVGDHEGGMANIAIACMCW